MPKTKIEFNNLPKININDSALDKIWAYYKKPDKVILSEKQENVHERLRAAWTSLVAGNPKTFVSNMLQMVYGLSVSQSYKYIQKSEILFGKVLKASVAGQRAVLYEMALQNHKEMKEAGQHKVAALYFKELKSLLGEEDIINFNPAKLEDKPDHYSIPPIVLEAIKEQFKTGTVDFNNLEIEDIPHEEIEDNE
jgi:hypothetical protein